MVVVAKNGERINFTGDGLEIECRNFAGAAPVAGAQQHIGFFYSEDFMDGIKIAMKV